MKSNKLNNEWKANLSNLHSSMATLRKSKKAVILENKNDISCDTRWGSTMNEIKSYLNNDKDNDLVLKQ